MQNCKIYKAEAIQLVAVRTRRTVRKHLNADSFIKTIREDYQKIPDHRADNVKVSLDDALMSAFAMFHLKDPSLLAFDKRRREEPENLHSVYGIADIPCDSQMRDILDAVEPSSLRPAFCSVFRQVQRGKDLEAMTFLDGHYLLSGDGTGYYSSSKVSSPYCLRKTHRNGVEMYYQQMYVAALVHPDHKEVIPFFPEMITRKDGATKDDCERNAARRFFEDFRREHPHLKVIVTEDGLSSNAPHILDLKRLGFRFILGVKPGDHQFLFEQVDQQIEQGKVTEFSYPDQDDPEKLHYFRFINQVPLNQSNKDLLVNFLEYWQVGKDDKITRFSWVTDLTITRENAFDIMRAGRARWKIENETFNTLKNQGYNLGHNYGLGQKNLSVVFTILMLLAFLVDQVLQMSCWLFKEAWQKAESKRELWECIRSYFRLFRVDSMETIYRVIAHGIEGYMLIQTE
jgi:hypothetical protein